MPMTDWNQITTEEAYRLDQAQFKGMVLQALQDIRNDVSDIKKDQAVKSWITFGVSTLIAGITGALGGVMGQIMKGRA